VLGLVELTRPDGVAEPIGSVRLRRALALLTVNSGSVVSADRLSDLLWGQSQPANPQAALHTVISRLRARLAVVGLTDRLSTRAPGYLLRLDRADCDEAIFTDLIDYALSTIDDDPVGTVDLLDTALALWRGGAYAEFADEEFAAAEVARLTEYRTSAAETRTEAALATGRAAEAIALAEREIAHSPLRERPRALLMLALYRTGRQPEALAAFREFRALLDDELALTPSQRLLALEAQILRQDPALAGPDTPAPRSAGRTRRVGNLPLAPPSLIGRDLDIDALADHLDRHRLVTVTGPGGVGKTQLALAAAARAAAGGRFPQGVWWIELAPLRRAASIADAVTTVLSVSPAAGRSMLDRLLDYLGTQRALIVLDNCEHLIDGVAGLVTAILERCPDLTVVATSQVPLNLSVEIGFPLNPLQLRDQTGSATPAAVRLFVERASRVVPGYAPTEPELAVVAELCQRLDGMPLAIELAASRMRFMTPREVLQRLPDRFRLLRTADRLAAERHSNLRSVVAWSYDLLDPTQQELFDRLSVFRGGFGFTDASVIADRPEADVIDSLESLVERSMVQATVVDGADVTTFTLLETLRAYGAERLVERGDEQPARRRHAQNMLELVRAGAAAVNGPDPGPWVRSVVAQFDDLRAAHAWALDNDLLLALRFVAGLVDWLEFQVSAELVDWAEQTARRSIAAGLDDPEIRRLTVTALAMASAGGRFGGDLARALLLSDESVALAEDPADPVLRYPLYVRSEVNLYQGRLDECISVALQVHPLAERADDVLRMTWSVMNRLLAMAYGGDLDEAITIAQNLADEKGLTGITRAWARYAVGEVLMAIHPDRSLVILEQVVDDARRLSDRFLSGVALLSAASLRARNGDPTIAVPMFREVLEHWHRLGNWTQRWTSYRTIADIVARLGDPESAALLVGAARAESRPARAYGPDADRLELQERLLATLGAERLRELMTSGAVMTDDAVFQLARAALARQDRSAGRPQSTGSSR